MIHEKTLKKINVSICYKTKKIQSRLLSPKSLVQDLSKENQAFNFIPLCYCNFMQISRKVPYIDFS